MSVFSFLSEESKAYLAEKQLMSPSRILENYLMITDSPSEYYSGSGERTGKNSQKTGKLLEKVQEKCLDVVIEVAKKGQGALIVVGDTNKYDQLFPNLFDGKKISVFDKGMEKVLVKLAEMDGAVIVDTKGRIKTYGAYIKKQVPFKGGGTRHAAAKGISLNGCTAILASEEDKNVKIFKNGIPLVEINPFTRGVENHLTKIVRFVNKPEAYVVAGGALGATVLGIALLPGIVVFAGSYYVAKQVFNLAKKKGSKAAE